ncbi:MAG TPA: hypothetical protein VIK30_06455 [Polyangia bacterium]
MIRGAISAGCALVIGTAAVGVGCHRNAAPGPAAVDGAAPPRRPAARATVPFSHPLLAGATTEVRREDCSRPALAVVVKRALAIEAKAAPAAGGRAQPAAADPGPAPGAGDGCSATTADENERRVRGELLTRVAACVARDGPLDAEWDMVHSALLSIGVCLDCRRTPPDQAAQCRHARDVLGRVAKTRR